MEVPKNPKNRFSNDLLNPSICYQIARTIDWFFIKLRSTSKLLSILYIFSEWNFHPRLQCATVCNSRSDHQRGRENFEIRRIEPGFLGKQYFCLNFIKKAKHLAMGLQVLCLLLRGLWFLFVGIVGCIHHYYTYLVGS